MNLFKFLKNYKDTSVLQSYGDILEGKSDITDVMSDVEKSVYMQLKNNDKKRIIVPTIWLQENFSCSIK